MLNSRMSQFSSEEFRAVFDSSASVREALLKLGYVIEGSAYQTFYRRCEAEGLDVQQLRNRTAMMRADVCRERWSPHSLSELLVEGSSYPTRHLRDRLLKEGLIENVCAGCGRGPEWEGRPLVLVLDHINGINNDHRRENLRLLCPNCNSQTDTFCGKHTKKRCYHCADCGDIIAHGSTRCRRCSNRLNANRRKAPRAIIDSFPSNEDLRAMKVSMTWEEIGGRFGVSSTTVKNRIRDRGGDISTFPDRRK